jgi:superfamily I DNA/RNA helicase
VYIRNLGYAVEIPEKLKIGNDVIETIFLEKNEEIEYIRCRLKNEDFSSAGVVAKNYEYLTEFKKAFSNNDKIHVMTMLESQGVEFDIIFLVGIDKELFNVANFEENGLREEKNRINHDLLYVALTRAISELHVLGKDKLSVIFEQNSGC